MAGGPSLAPTYGRYLLEAMEERNNSSFNYLRAFIVFTKKVKETAIFFIGVDPGLKQITPVSVQATNLLSFFQNRLYP